MTEHQHTCVACTGRYTCALACDELEDGEPICGPCAKRRFDEIKPQEFGAYRAPDLKVSEYGLAIPCSAELELGSFDVMSLMSKSLARKKRQYMDHLAGCHAGAKQYDCGACFPPPPEKEEGTWASVPRGIFNTLRVRLARWIGGEALRDEIEEDDYDD